MVLRAPGGLDPAAFVGDAESPQDRVVLGQEAGLAAVVPALRLGGILTGGRALGGVQHRLELLGDAQLVGVLHGVHVPVPERLVEQVVHRRPGGLPQRVVAGVRLGLVVGGHLQVAAGAQVDVPELDATPARAGALAPTGADRADQAAVVEDLAAQPGESAGQRLGHDYPSRAETATIRINATSATGITRRR